MSAKIDSLSRLRPAEGKVELAAVVERLRISRDITHNIRLGGQIRELPSAGMLKDVVEGLTVSLFPTHLGPAGLSREGIDIFVGNTLQTATVRLIEQVHRGLQFDTADMPPAAQRRKAAEIVQGLVNDLPAIRALLVSDIKAAYRRDTSAGSLAEILLGYRSAVAIIQHRIAHSLYRLGAKLVARVISGSTFAGTAIDIHPGASIGSGLFIDSGAGVVIGETAVIGDNVVLHQNVTLGSAEAVSSGEAAAPKGRLRHPIVEDNVVIHAGATILGRISIGAGSVIGGNVWLTRSVPPGSVITQASSIRSDVQVMN